jgi:hypothetical protein
MLYLALSQDVDNNSLLRFFPSAALVALISVPLVAAGLSGSANPWTTGAGGIAVGVATTVVVAGLRTGGTGVTPLTLGIAVGGIIGLRADAHTHFWLRGAVTALLAVYAVVSGRLITLVFVYPLLGFADEFADAIVARKSKASEKRELTRETSARN